MPCKGRGRAARALPPRFAASSARRLSPARLLDPVAEALERVLAETNTARARIEEALAVTAFEPKELERAEERLFALRALARKHKVTVDDLPALVERLEAELAALDTSEARAGELAEAAAAAARKTYEALATGLSKARQRGGEAPRSRRSRASSGRSSSKKRASSPISKRSSWPKGGPSGIDRVAFWVRTNPGTEPGPLMKVASGGELARFILALKVVLAARGSAPTLVFDEADAGVGGATAAAVGERLARLAATRPGAGRDPRAAGGGRGQRPSPDRQGAGARPGRRGHGDARRRSRRRASARGDRAHARRPDHHRRGAQGGRAADEPVRMMRV